MRHKLPLVIALYWSQPSFETSTGDEIPIFALIRSGVAVMTFSAALVPGGSQQNQRWELSRMKRPVQAIRELIHRSEAFGIDPSRVGLSGLSYGSEIAMYAYWRSRDFRAISSATGSVSPSWLFLGGQGYASQLAERGFVGAERSDIWQKISAALNARPNLPPLLWQSPDAERYYGVETWYYLRRAGAPVEWLEYPDEFHIKSSPANRWWVHNRNLDWFRFWLQDYEDPDPAKAAQYARWRKMRDEAAARRNSGADGSDSSKAPAS